MSNISLTFLCGDKKALVEALQHLCTESTRAPNARAEEVLTRQDKEEDV